MFFVPTWKSGETDNGNGRDGAIPPILVIDQRCDVDFRAMMIYSSPGKITSL
ncbi:hypothetical protein LTR10_001409 [Elasticomyces elasticus]|nr:hypothetical protein LTR10_001409 [Elasticomyces elasticus]KAK4974910.1 hypothetical protein LTR42_004119 [Elasticomyces elasticus]